MALKFFHTPKNKQFNFTTRYYDEQKEDLENRINQIKREMGYTDEQANEKPYASNIKGRIRENIRKSRHANQSSNIRLLIIIAILSLVAYFLFFA
jgi:hypothetical protein